MQQLLSNLTNLPAIKNNSFIFLITFIVYQKLIKQEKNFKNIILKFLEIKKSLINESYWKIAYCQCNGPTQILKFGKIG